VTVSTSVSLLGILTAFVSGNQVLKALANIEGGQLFHETTWSIQRSLMLRAGSGHNDAISVGR
jgi:hypothetical protein